MIYGVGIRSEISSSLNIHFNEKGPKLWTNWSTTEISLKYVVCQLFFDFSKVNKPLNDPIPPPPKKKRKSHRTVEPEDRFEIDTKFDTWGEIMKHDVKE